MKVMWVSYDPDVPTKDVYWDMTLLEDLLFDCEHQFGITEEEEGIIVIPARRQPQFVDRFNEDIQKVKKVIVLVMGDEEFVFDFKKLSHPDMILWVQSAMPEMGIENAWPLGYPRRCRQILKGLGYVKPTKDLFFAGQITHSRREACAAEMDRIIKGGIIKGEVLRTEGFTQGFTQETYFQKLIDTKIIPCPTGPEIPDTFRVYETLEAGRIPIADTITSKGKGEGFWDEMLPGAPIPVIRTYESLTGITQEWLQHYILKSNELYAWWQKYKRDLKYRLIKPNSDVTVVIPSSHISTHPNTEIIEETISTVRVHLPTSEIIITLDGGDYGNKNYEEYKARLLWKCNFEWENVVPVIFSTHKQQCGMLKHIIGDIRTPLILYVEHDAPLTPDRSIEWENLKQCIYQGKADLIRFLHEEHVHQEHKHLTLGEDKEAHLIKTMQWSQRPHLASKTFYERILKNYFSDKPEFIEDVMHGIVHNACTADRATGWFGFRLWIYAPPDDPLGIKRSYHLDGRKTL